MQESSAPSLVVPSATSRHGPVYHSIQLTDSRDRRALQKYQCGMRVRNTMAFGAWAIDMNSRTRYRPENKGSWGRSDDHTTGRGRHNRMSWSQVAPGGQRGYGYWGRSGEGKMGGIRERSDEGGPGSRDRRGTRLGRSPLCLPSLGRTSISDYAFGSAVIDPSAEVECIGRFAVRAAQSRRETRPMEAMSRSGSDATTPTDVTPCTSLRSGFLSLGWLWERWTQVFRVRYGKSGRLDEDFTMGDPARPTGPCHGVCHGTPSALHGDCN
ncbi:hypothetical protein BS50DRAFT_279000 [Corynespora cassiicola Philippines]|uniref:Uncharacterized protein n=1 Tax=Corynespora cassiicola Philippines TaxID=1448308 RepID=A0A2T2P0S5_CORCC|nr:hypothetical protein BS50DRAFT_279000 [Corynespora cassiicola Philippines]